MNSFIFRKVPIIALGTFLSIILTLLSCSKDSTPTPAPALTSISQNPLAPGGSFTITGANFDLTAANNALKFGSTSVTVSASTATTLTATLPSNFAAGSYEVSVTIKGQTGKLSGNVEVVPTAPGITNFNPAGGLAGTAVTITGTNFDATPVNNIVTLNESSTALPVTAASATSITFTLPNDLAVGNYTLKVKVKQNNETSTQAVSATDFVLFVAPTITDFAPLTATSSQTVTITGTNFSTTPANNTVKFGSVTATVNSASATQLGVTVPGGLTEGNTYKLSVTVSISGVTTPATQSAGNFTFANVPTVTTVSASAITEMGASSGGNVTSNGGSAITQKGICWSTTANPTVSDQYSNDGSGSSNYSSSLSKLLPGTLYHMRAYAVNASGTSYGNDVTFTTSNTAVSSGLVAYYRFNGDTKDYSGQGNDLAPTNVTFVNDHNGTSSSAASFDGSTSKATSSVGTNFNNSTAASISIWFNATSTNSWTIFEEVYTHLIVYDAAYNQTGIGQCSPSCDLAYITTPSRNTWHHLVGLSDVPNKTFTLYLDGIQVATSSMGASSNFNTHNWEAGYNHNVSTYWQGSIGKVKVYNRLLSASEVTALYNE